MVSCRMLQLRYHIDFGMEAHTGGKMLNLIAMDAMVAYLKKSNKKMNNNNLRLCLLITARSIQNAPYHVSRIIFLLFHR